MRRLLLQTHVLLWWLADAQSLGQHAREILSDARHEVYVSAASGWDRYGVRTLTVAR
ncbi:type II toxin-antitoxin system VapC family toxin [Aquisalimonas sp. 2447]|uniref:type II toxin-antitoxin system VapC family toxin n=1 Tax=Aquisalimonas sp. 2447 TaxID=2740807 RepID=UPI0014327A4A|nr:type II toxin-antitoxin system VapC family toxin [Aquisalimonas sp. 2447]QIT55928.1 type II toxin-antitoxin system VapC family toxin [Aquisalimonas sp. 2447]